MKRGFLLVDQMKNTIIINGEDFDLYELLACAPFEKRQDLLASVHQHETRRDLYADIGKYLDNKYEG